MNILVFEHNDFGIEDIKEAFEEIGHSYTVISTDHLRERVSSEFDMLFEKAYSSKSYDCVFTFNYSPVLSNNCKKVNLPYIALVYDSPQVMLYSYTIINPCNYVFIFDKAMYLDLKNAGINTVYYVPLCANTKRLSNMPLNDNPNLKADISFVGSMYNEKHNLYDRMVDAGLSDFARGYLEAIMDAQMNVYGDFFLDSLLGGKVLEDMQKAMPVVTNSDGVETIEYMYAHYFLARKLANKERTAIFKKLEALTDEYDIKLFTPNATPELPRINNCGPIDYYNHMPYVFKNSKINLNISLRSIRSGIPLRGIDVMGAGGFLLSNYQADYYDFFEPGGDLVLFESHEDLIDKCKYYLSHESERADIAKSGFEKINEYHTYTVRLQEIFEFVFN